MGLGQGVRARGKAAKSIVRQQGSKRGWEKEFGIKGLTATKTGKRLKANRFRCEKAALKKKEKISDELKEKTCASLDFPRS